MGPVSAVQKAIICLVRPRTSNEKRGTNFSRAVESQKKRRKCCSKLVPCFSLKVRGQMLGVRAVFQVFLLFFSFISYYLQNEILCSLLSLSTVI